MTGIALSLIRWQKAKPKAPVRVIVDKAALERLHTDVRQIIFTFEHEGRFEFAQVLRAHLRAVDPELMEVAS